MAKKPIYCDHHATERLEIMKMPVGGLLGTGTYEVKKCSKPACPRQWSLHNGFENIYGPAILAPPVKVS
jgi:hypothetical protein